MITSVKPYLFDNDSSIINAMKKIVVVADDYGLCPAVNHGIVEAHQKGIVTELSLMLGSPGTDHALELIKSHDIHNVGIHMLLKHWRDTGATVRRPGYVELFAKNSEATIAALIAAELAEFERLLGRQPSHITSQYGILSNAKALPTITEYAAKYEIPMRQPRSVDDSDLRDPNSPNVRYILEHNVRTTDNFITHIDDFTTLDDTRSAYQTDLGQLPDNTSVEICLHPGTVDDELRSLTSLVDERQRDLALATDPAFRHWLDSHDFKLVPYSEI